MQRHCVRLIDQHVARERMNDLIGCAFRRFVSIEPVSVEFLISISYRCKFEPIDTRSVTIVCVHSPFNVSMNANEDFSYAQQLHRSLMAKSDWASLLIDVQRSTDDKLHRRSRMHRQANDFLRDLLDQRPEPSSIDDYATFDHCSRRQSQVTPDMFVHDEQTSITIDALETIEIGNDEKAIVQRVHIEQERVGRSSHRSFSPPIDSSV